MIDELKHWEYDKGYQRGYQEGSLSVTRELLAHSNLYQIRIDVIDKYTGELKSGICEFTEEQLEYFDEIAEKLKEQFK